MRVRKRIHTAMGHENGADYLILPEHRHTDKTADAALSNVVLDLARRRQKPWVALVVTYAEHAPGADDGDWVPGVAQGARPAPPILRELLRGEVVAGNQVNALAIESVDVSEEPIAQPNGITDDRIEHRLDVRRR